MRSIPGVLATSVVFVTGVAWATCPGTSVKTGPRDEATVHRAIANLREATAEQCWGDGGERTRRAPSAPPSARVAFAFTIDLAGEVVQMKRTSSTPGYPDLAGCLARHVGAWRFARATNTSPERVEFALETPSH